MHAVFGANPYRVAARVELEVDEVWVQQLRRLRHRTLQRRVQRCEPGQLDRRADEAGTSAPSRGWCFELWQTAAERERALLAAGLLIAGAVATGLGVALEPIMISAAVFVSVGVWLWLFGAAVCIIGVCLRALRDDPGELPGALPAA